MVSKRLERGMMEKRKLIWLIRIAGVFFIISALGQGFCAIPEIKNAIKSLPSYWFNRIHMYCMVYKGIIIYINAHKYKLLHYLYKL